MSTPEERAEWVAYGICSQAKADEYAYHDQMQRTHRYTVMSFPAYFGNPLYTNSWLVARLSFLGRIVACCEARLVDNRTGRHYVA